MASFSLYMSLIRSCNEHELYKMCAKKGHELSILLFCLPLIILFSLSMHLYILLSTLLVFSIFLYLSHFSICVTLLLLNKIFLTFTYINFKVNMLVNLCMVVRIIITSQSRHMLPKWVIKHNSLSTFRTYYELFKPCMIIYMHTRDLFTDAYVGTWITIPKRTRISKGNAANWNAEASMLLLRTRLSQQH